MDNNLNNLNNPEVFSVQVSNPISEAFSLSPIQGVYSVKMLQLNNNQLNRQVVYLAKPNLKQVADCSAQLNLKLVVDFLVKHNRRIHNKVEVYSANNHSNKALDSLDSRIKAKQAEVYSEEIRNNNKINKKEVYLEVHLRLIQQVAVVCSETPHLEVNNLHLEVFLEETQLNNNHQQVVSLVEHNRVREVFLEVQQQPNSLKLQQEVFLEASNLPLAVFLVVPPPNNNLPLGVSLEILLQILALEGYLEGQREPLQEGDYLETQTIP